MIRWMGWLLPVLTLITSLFPLFPASAAEDPDLPRPPEITSRHGVLRVTLVAGPQTVVIDGVSFNAQTFNGSYAGPLLRVHPGDRMIIRLVNHLTESTNLHFHGIQTSPRGNGDNVAVVVRPGREFTYRIRIPEFQPPGMYWYHSHYHGMAQKQVNAGLSGGLLVEGLSRRIPELAAVRDRVLVVKDHEIEEDAPDAEQSPDRHNLLVSVNGAAGFTIRMRSGETELWHISNQSSDRLLHLSISQHDLRIVGVDGDTVTHAFSDRAVVDVLPSGRVSALITARAPGRYEIRANKVLTGQGPNQTLYRVVGWLDVSGSDVSETFQGIRRFPGQRDLRDAKIDVKRTVIFSQSQDGRQFFVDGRTFDHLRTDARVPLGNIEEWTIRNLSYDLHVFHIHQLPFQVVEVNGSPRPFDGYVDTAAVPEVGEIKIRLAFTNPEIAGRFVYHCHLLEHEDKGMMATIEVYDPAVLRRTVARRPKFTLTDQRGTKVTEHSLAGHYSLIYFGYTHCGDLCPTTLSTMADALDALRPRLPPILPVMVTVDPDRDRPADLGEYVAQFSPAMLGLTGPSANILALARQFGAFFERAGSGEDYTIDHTSDLYLVGPDGRFLATFPYGLSSGDLADAIAAKIQSPGDDTSPQPVSRSDDDQSSSNPVPKAGWKVTAPAGAAPTSGKASTTSGETPSSARQETDR
ncbi:MAG: multicopper oxidase domain-containing protein [Telmatospirillum sp.]|nr:multicopper oxidase domain-containing protein [Telmatospirillum sp.]